MIPSTPIMKGVRITWDGKRLIGTIRDAFRPEGANHVHHLLVRPLGQAVDCGVIVGTAAGVAVGVQAGVGVWNPSARTVDDGTCIPNQTKKAQTQRVRVKTTRSLRVILVHGFHLAIELSGVVVVRREKSRGTE